jgi:2,4-dienoyl-CoA reductase-like NADH-dependent reductase (Old Yellow Enzyme family)/thioredoxin reductase
MIKFDHLFAEGKIGNLKTRNRIIMSALEPGFADGNGNLQTNETAAYYSLRARGGTGIIITGNIAVTPNGRASNVQGGIWSDEHIAPFSKVAEAVHKEGGLFFIQLSHAGREVHPFLDWKPVAPSAIQSPTLRSEPEELSVQGIKEIINAFADGAERAVKAGADGIELHGAHGYLICQFLSPNMNKRTDNYGGSTHNRARFAIEVIEAIRKRVGKEYPISFRLSADEYIPDGIKLPEAIEYSGMLEEAGISLLSVTACNYESANYNLPNYYLEEGCFVELSRKIKKEVSIPVTVVGRIRTPQLANDILKAGDADFISIGRALVADPYFSLKAEKNKEKQIRPCLSCNKCIDSLSKGSICCAVNDSLREENWPPVYKEANGKKAFIAGAGPSGITAAQALAVEGFDVTVFEKEDHCGGKLNYADLPPRKYPFEEYKNWLSRQLEACPAKVRYSTPLTTDIIESEKPDLIIIATGAHDAPPPFEVLPDTVTLTVEEAFSTPEKLGSTPAIIGGGGEGSELADFISENEQKVTLLERKRKLASDILPSVRHFLMERLENKGVTIIPRFKVSKIGPGFIEGQRGTKGTDRLDGFSAIILATGLASDVALADNLKEKGYSVHIIGDALAPGSIMEAVKDGGAFKGR